EIKKQLEESGFSYNLVATEFKRTLDGLALINLSAYNEYAKKLGYEIEKLTNENDSIAIRLNKKEKSTEHLKFFEINHGELEIPLSVQKTVYIPELAMIDN
ncbi:ABC transporter permease, partial [Bacillus anthracis]